MSAWTNIDSRNAALASIVPLGLGYLQYRSFRPGQSNYTLLMTSTKPSWTEISPSTYGLMDLASLTPLGYASYLVYKYGGGFDYKDTTAALILYGTSLIFSGTCTPLSEKRDYKWLLFNKAVAFASGVGFAYAFSKINQDAGLLALPYAAVSGFWLYFYYTLYQMNNDKKHRH